jgi:hypothetical protein
VSLLFIINESYLTADLGLKGFIAATPVVKKHGDGIPADSILQRQKSHPFDAGKP